MKHIKIWMFAMLLVLVMPVCLAAGEGIPDTCVCSHVDEIVAKEVQQMKAMVKTEVEKQLDKDLIDLKIDNIAKEKTDKVLTKHDELISKHISLIGILFTLVAGVVAIAIPMIFDKERKGKMNEMKRKMDEMKGKMDELKGKMESLEHIMRNEEIEMTYMRQDMRTTCNWMEDLAKKAEESSKYAEFSVELSRALNHKDMEIQIGLFSNLIKRYQESDYVSYAYNSRGNSYYTLNNFTRAVEDYTEATKRNPSFADAYYNCGLAKYNQGYYDEAIKLFTKAKDIGVESAELYYARGETYGKQGDNDKAIDDYNEALRLRPGYAVVYYLRGGIYERIDKYDEAIQDYSEAIRFQPDYLEAYSSRCSLFKSKGKYDDALIDAEKGLEIAKRKGNSQAINNFEQMINDIKPNKK